MKIAVKCFATLADAETCDYKDSRTYDFDAGADINTLMLRLDIPKDSVKLVFVNSRKADFDTRLSDGDQVALAPAVGGM
jgi:molybdopterin converting factor small subunit